MIKRRLSVGRLKPGCAEKYIDAHNNIPAAVLEEYKQSGIIKISCFLRDNQDLYIYSEIETDIADTFDRSTMVNDEEFQKIMKTVGYGVYNSDDIIEVFHLDTALI